VPNHVHALAYIFQRFCSRNICTYPFIEFERWLLKEVKCIKFVEAQKENTGTLSLDMTLQTALEDKGVQQNAAYVSCLIHKQIVQS
jgi:hypothetical protein